MEQPSDSASPEAIVYSSDSLQESRAQVLAEEAFRQVFDNGLSYALVIPTKPVIWAEQNEITTGILIYSPGLEDAFLFIDLIFVRPEFRRHGISTLLIRTLLVRAARTGIRHVVCGVHQDNQAMMKCLRQSGLEFEPEEGAFLLASLILTV